LNPEQQIIVSATIHFGDHDELEIPFILSAAHGNNYNICLNRHDTFDFVKFNTKFDGFPNPILCIYASPIAFVSTNEEFALEPKIMNKVTSRQSFLFLRNRIYRISRKPNYQLFKEDVSYILSGGVDHVDYEIIGDISYDIEILVNIKTSATSKYKDISLLGSGTLQIIELMLAIYEERKNINLILLDEPDSHIHRDIQKRLIEVLSRNTTNAQVFITTHNESLIRSTKPENLYHITNTGNGVDTTICKPVIHSALPRRKVGLMPSHHAKVLRSVGDENSLDLINAIEAHKLILVEGDDDADNLQKILDIHNCQKDIAYWAFRGIDTLIQKISHYKDFLKGIGCNTSLWDKCLLVIDADHMTDVQLQQLKLDFNNRLVLKSHIWSSYTIESTILTDFAILITLIRRYYISLGLTKSTDEIEVALTATVTDFKTMKLNILANEAPYRESITGQINARNKNLTEHLKFNQVFQGSPINFFSNYEIYARQQLEANNIAHLCNKDDVENFVHSVFEKIGFVPIKSTSYFHLLMSVADNTVSFPEWRAFYSLTNQ
jgi:energy-coupling factor transporter ATP-binding protein EcfA2